MAKSIKIDDSVYDLLKGMADRDFRTVSQQIAFLIDYYEKNKSQNPKNGSGSQANKQEPTVEHIGRREVRSVPHLIDEINLIKARYAEEAEFCQDQEQLNNLKKNMAAEIQPLQAQIDSMI